MIKTGAVVSSFFIRNDIVRQDGIASDRFAMNVAGDIDPDPPTRNILFQLDLRTGNIASGAYLQPTGGVIDSVPSVGKSLLLETEVDEAIFNYRRVANIIDPTYDSKNLVDFEVMQGAASFDTSGDTFTVTNAPFIVRSLLRGNNGNGKLNIGAKIILNPLTKVGGVISVGNQSVSESRSISTSINQRYGFRYTDSADVGYVYFTFFDVGEEYTVIDLMVENKLGYPDDTTPSEYVRHDPTGNNNPGANVPGVLYSITENPKQINASDGVITDKASTSQLPVAGLLMWSARTNLMEYENADPKCKEPTGDCEIKGVEPSNIEDDEGVLIASDDTVNIVLSELASLDNTGQVIELMQPLGAEKTGFARYKSALPGSLIDNHILSYYVKGEGLLGYSDQDEIDMLAFATATTTDYERIEVSAIPDDDRPVFGAPLGTLSRAILGDLQKGNYATAPIVTDLSSGGVSRAATRFRTWTQDRFKNNDVSGFVEFEPAFNYDQDRPNVMQVDHTYKDANNQFLITLEPTGDVFTMTKIVNGVSSPLMQTILNDIQFTKGSTIKLAFSLSSVDGMRLQVNQATHINLLDTTSLNLDLTLTELQYLCSGVSQDATIDCVIKRVSMWDAPLTQAEMEAMTS